LLSIPVTSVSFFKGSRRSYEICLRVLKAEPKDVAGCFAALDLPLKQKSAPIQNP
jgi:hypothetical protein